MHTLVWHLRLIQLYYLIQGNNIYHCSSRSVHIAPSIVSGAYSDTDIGQQCDTNMNHDVVSITLVASKNKSYL